MSILYIGAPGLRVRGFGLCDKKDISYMYHLSRCSEMRAPRADDMLLGDLTKHINLVAPSWLLRQI